MTIPLRFGVEDIIPDSALSCTIDPDPNTSLDELKNRHRERQVVWAPDGRDIAVNFTLTRPRIADVVALPTESLTGLDKIRIELFSDADQQVQAYTTDFIRLGELPAIGTEFIAGYDAFGVPLDDDRPEILVRWLDETTICQSGRLTIRLDEEVGDREEIALSTLFVGRRVQLEHNFEYGAAFQFLSDPALVPTATGRMLPGRVQQRVRRLSISLPMMTTSDRRALKRMELSLGNQSFVVGAYGGRQAWEHEEGAYFGLFDRALGYTHRAEGVYRTNMEIVQA